MKESMTYHVAVERKNRVENMIEKIGLGQIIKERYCGYGIGPKAGRYICVTDTGITIIKDETRASIITMYVTTQRELQFVYGGAKKIPPFLRKKVDHNQSLFTKDGKTIWKE